MPPQQAQHKQQYTRSVGITPLLFGCSATQRMPSERLVPRATCAPRDGEYATMTTPEHSMIGAGAIASDLSISPGILSTGTRPTDVT